MSNIANRSSFPILISIFFFWGFVAASNTILIPIFKEHFSLMQWQSQLVDFAFYAAYFFGSLLYFVISYFRGDPLGKIGYKRGLILGLLISAAGALCFVPAAQVESFALMLCALFIVAIGFTLQQIVANPYVIALGNPATGSHRVNLAGGINSFGTTIGPLLLSFAIFGTISTGAAGGSGLEAVKMPYVILSIAFVAFALLLAFSKLPPITMDSHVEHSMKAFKYPQLVLGMIAIFVYVGVEVTIQSNLPELMRQPYILGLESNETVHFISLYWGTLMIGRWTGALTLFRMSVMTKRIMTVVVPLIAFLVILGVNHIKLTAAGNTEAMSDLYGYFPYIFILIAGFFMAQEKPARTMILFSVMAAVMMIIGMLTEGRVALYSFICGGLFCSVMWPCIFSLSIAGLGKYTTQGSSMLIMMILGGAVIPPLQGYLADITSIHLSYFIPVICFSYLAFYGFKVKHVLKKQGIDYDANVSSSH